MWTEKETYFVIIEPAMFNYTVPIEISKGLGYGDTIKYFGQIVWIAKELKDDRWGCSIQLMPEYKLPVQGVKSWITKNDYETAINLLNSLFGIAESELLTESVFKTLEFKEVELT
ncbi:MAG: hypothetical protein ACXAC7_12270 [Candidatus Hodarchaeales archaeon]|jgi:hypothetical protein